MSADVSTDEMPALHVEAQVIWGVWVARVIERGALLTVCGHAHLTENAALLCAGDMAREILVARAEEREEP